MRNLIKTLIILLTFSFAVTPAMAKDESKSSKSKSSEVKKSKKVSKKDKKKKSSSKEKGSQSSKSSKGNSGKSSGDDADSKRSTSSSSSSSGSKSSKKSTSKKNVKSRLTGTDKAKQFKNVTVNINKADAETLAYYLVGIGETRAKDIVKYRKKNGKFKNIEELMEVPGIGEAIFAGLKKNTSTSRGETSTPSSTTSKKTKK